MLPYIEKKPKTFAGTLRAPLLGPSEAPLLGPSGGTTPRAVWGQHIVSIYMIICYKTVENINIFHQISTDLTRHNIVFNRYGATTSKSYKKELLDFGEENEDFYGCQTSL